MQRKKNRSRSAWRAVVVVAILAGALIHGAKAQRVALGTELGSLAEIVQTDGGVRLPVSGAALCTGWKLRVDPMLRARFVHTGGSASPMCQVRRGDATPVYWDDQLLLTDVTGQVRAFRAGDEAVYVDVRFAFRRSGVTVSGILKWDATTGRWYVVGNTSATPTDASTAG